MNKCKFCKITQKTTDLKTGCNYSWFEWFCLSETWVHPYNRKNDRAKAFQDWSEKNWDDLNNFCCPDITIQNEKLNDGFESDVTGRIACDFNDEQIERDICMTIEQALETGRKQTYLFDNQNVKLEVIVEPVESIQIDPKSVKDFGPYAIDALTGLVDNPEEWIKTNIS